MSTPPPGFTLHPQLAKIYEARKQVRRISWRKCRVSEQVCRRDCMVVPAGVVSVSGLAIWIGHRGGANRSLLTAGISVWAS